MPEYTSNCVNMAKSVWMNFDFHAPIVKPCLLECVITYFNKIYSLKEHEVTIYFGVISRD